MQPPRQQAGRQLRAIAFGPIFQPDSQLPCNVLSLGFLLPSPGKRSLHLSPLVVPALFLANPLLYLAAQFSAEKGSTPVPTAHHPLVSGSVFSRVGICNVSMHSHRYNANIHELPCNAQSRQTGPPVQLDEEVFLMNTRSLRTIPAALLMTTAAAWSLPAAAESSVGMEATRSAPAVATSRAQPAPTATSRPGTSMQVAQASGSTGGTTGSPSGSQGSSPTGLPPAVVPAMPASTASGAKPMAPQGGMAPGVGGKTGTSGTMMPPPATPAPKR